jgi:hypothetical protein
MADHLLSGYMTLTKASEQEDMPSKRTLDRMLRARKLPVTYFGNRPLLNVAKFRAMLRANEIKPVGERRGRK